MTDFPTAATLRMGIIHLAFLLALTTTTANPAQAAEESEDLSDAAAADAGTEVQPLTLEELVRSVREGNSARRRSLIEREQRFIEARDERATLLEEMTRARQEQEALADQLRRRFEVGEDELSDLETLLEESSSDLKDVFTAVNQVAADTRASVQNSMVAAELGDRSDLLSRLASADTLPSAADLRALWLLLLDEMHESGRVARFEAPVIIASGEEEVLEVTRIGTFTALASGEYLRYLPDSGRLLALARQPAGTSRSDALAFEAAEAPLATVALDPSRGAILSLVVQTPALEERIAQGGVIGYLILVLGLVGFTLGLERLLHVAIASRRNRKALTHNDVDHPIGQLRAVAQDPDYLTDADALSAKMDEIVTVASQRLNRGLPALAIFAAVSPLLGLLGTVTGMIETFQVITLFGAGDPRLMSGGISQALITTQLGLAVAIPLLLIHSFAQSRSNTLITELDEMAADVFAQSRAGRNHPGTGAN
ncbi:MAG: MotA/TolQ/ExbB proton channel family protein [Pseudomonadota bacterium]